MREELFSIMHDLSVLDLGSDMDKDILDEQLERLRALAEKAGSAEPVAVSCADHDPGETGYVTFSARVPHGARLYASAPPSQPVAPDFAAIAKAAEEEQSTLVQLGHGVEFSRGWAGCAAYMAARAAETTSKPQPVADRETARARFPDPAFNRWLDEGISDAGHTVFCAIGDVSDAWAAWSAKDYYAQQPVALPDGWVAVPREPTEEMIIAACDVEYCEQGITRGMLRAAIAAAPAGEGCPMLSAIQAPRCPKCGYTKRDCRNLMDHHLCGEPDPAPACDTCNDSGWIGGPSCSQPDEGGEPCPDCSAPEVPRG